MLLEDLLGLLPGLGTLSLVNPDLLLVVSNSTHAVVWAKLDLRDPSLSMFCDDLDLLPGQILFGSITGKNPQVASFHSNNDDAVIV